MCERENVRNTESPLFVQMAQIKLVGNETSRAAEHTHAEESLCWYVGVIFDPECDPYHLYPNPTHANNKCK